MYTLVSPMNVEQYWPTLAPWIAKAIGGDDPGEDLAIIKHKACNSVAQIWVGASPELKKIDLVLVTEGMVLEGIPTLVLRWLTAANFEECAPDLALVERWAYHQGYKRLQAWGRHGWERKLKPLGFVHSFTVMDKFIEQGLH